MLKRVIRSVLVVTIVSILLSACGFGDICFSNIDLGENFAGNRDGHFKKLPNNYCLDVELKSTTRLFKVADEYLNTPWDSSKQHDEYILKGHFIKGFYNDNFLILCEEKSDDSLAFYAFDFYSHEIKSDVSERDVYDEYGFDSTQWFVLCNTNAEILN